MNKADYEALINANLPDGGNIPSADHRRTMLSDPNSIGEVVYGDVLNDTSALETHTTSNANFSYTIYFYKTGNNNVIAGRFGALQSANTNSVILQMDNTDFLAISASSFSAVGRSILGRPDLMPIYFIENELRISQSILVGESFGFTINYKSLN